MGCNAHFGTQKNYATATLAAHGSLETGQLTPQNMAEISLNVAFYYSNETNK